ncbi:HIT family protein [Candidatus Kuenenbacteria bacterium]|nr:HIT family protein [Candidatus Kuenenbacteria bacterium]
MKECFFCQIYKDKIDNTNLVNKIVYWGKNFYIRFDNVPVSPGHLEIVANRHMKSLADLDLGEWGELRTLIKKAIKIIESTNFEGLYKKFLKGADNKIFKHYAEEMLRSKVVGKKPAGYNIGVNEGLAGGQTVPHLHIHIIPRHKGDVLDPTGGVRNIIPKLGNYKKLIK